jgi:hypothetical protein
MVAALALVLVCGAVVAVLMDPNAEAAYMVVPFVLPGLGALVIAAVLLAPFALVRRRRRRPSEAQAANQRGPPGVIPDTSDPT